MNRVIFFGIVLAAAFSASPALAGPLNAVGVMSATPDGADWDYTIKLTNTGTVDIGTFWYSWMPGQGYLPSAPISMTPPTGWTDMQTNGPPPGDGFSIQAVAGAGFALAPGSSLLFEFKSADSPETLAGVSTIHPGHPIGTSFLYGGAPFSDAGQQIIVTSVPEPSTLVLGAVGAVGLFVYARARRKAKA